MTIIRPTIIINILHFTLGSIDAEGKKLTSSPWAVMLCWPECEVG